MRMNLATSGSPIDDRPHRAGPMAAETRMTSSCALVRPILTLEVRGDANRGNLNDQACQAPRPPSPGSCPASRLARPRGPVHRLLDAAGPARRGQPGAQHGDRHRQHGRSAGPRGLRSDGRLSGSPAQALPLPGGGAGGRLGRPGRAGSAPGGPTGQPRRGRSRLRRGGEGLVRGRRREPRASRPEVAASRSRASSRSRSAWSTPTWSCRPHSSPRRSSPRRTLRPKIHRVWDEYLKPLPNLNAKVRWTGSAPIGERVDPDALMSRLKVGGICEVPGYRGARARPCGGCGGSSPSGWAATRRTATSRRRT